MRPRFLLPTVGLIALVGFLAGRNVENVPSVLRVASADQTFSYTGGPFDTGRLSDELVAAGITPITIRAEGPANAATSIEIVVADGVQQSAVDAVVNAHDPDAPQDRLSVVRKGADQTSTTISLVNCNGLKFDNLLPNHSYDYEFRVYYTTAVNTTGLVLSIAGPTSPARLGFGAAIYESATTTRFVGRGAYDGEIVGQTSAGSTPLMATLTGSIKTGASGGTLVLRFRTEVNGSGVTILAGSVGHLFN